MTGPRGAAGAGAPHGVFSWGFPDGLLDDASALLDGRLAGVGR
jgi:hypothetical protein